jgi:hypothetical protein
VYSTAIGCRAPPAELFHVWPGVSPPAPFTDTSALSSVSEIETAIERLSPDEVKQIAVWPEDYRQNDPRLGRDVALYDQKEREKG